MNFPALFKRKKKLRATATRRAGVADPGYDDLSEPNMKLSRALLIVLLLHVVAVAGIIAFNAMKSRQGDFSPALSTEAAPRPVPVSAPLAAAPGLSERSERKSKTSDSGRADSVKYYVVAKGDNPVTIAKKLKVPYHDLLAVNHIDDPRKLKIGQKLIVPPRKAKRSEE